MARTLSMVYYRPEKDIPVCRTEPNILQVMLADYLSLWTFFSKHYYLQLLNTHAI